MWAVPISRRKKRGEREIGTGNPTSINKNRNTVGIRRQKERVWGIPDGPTTSQSLGVGVGKQIGIKKNNRPSGGG